MTLAISSFCGATAILVSRYLLSHQASPQMTCEHGGAPHIVVIKDEQLTPGHVSAKLCDALTIINEDARLRLMAFGEHDHHEAYDGVSEQVLAEGQSLTVTLNKAGTYKFHDHSDDKVSGTFTVSAH